MAKIKKYPKRGQQAVMIFDALMGIFLLMMVFCAMLSAMITGIQSGRRGREHLAASLAARQVVENIRSFRGAGITDGTYSDATTLGAVPQLSRLNQGTASATILAWSGRAHQAVITVNWYSVPGKRALSQTFTTLICSDGVAE